MTLATQATLRIRHLTRFQQLPLAAVVSTGMSLDKWVIMMPLAGSLYMSSNSAAFHNY
jgi:hypothetical protein